MKNNSIYLTAWNGIIARFNLAGLNTNSITKRAIKNGISFSALITNKGGFSCSSDGFRNEVKAIIINQLEDSMFKYDIQFAGLRVYLTIIS